MADLCDIRLKVEALNLDGEKQLQELLERSKVNGEEFSISGWESVPEEIDYIYPQGPIGAGVCIWQKRNGEANEIERFSPVKKSLIEQSSSNSNLTPDEIEAYLIKSNKADLEKGLIAFGYYKKHGILDYIDWSNKKWGTRWSTYSRIIKSTNKKLEVYFSTKYCPPDKWLEKVSSDLPDLKFYMDWEVFASSDGIIEANAGKMKYYRLTDEQWAVREGEIFEFDDEDTQGDPFWDFLPKWKME